ncbi:MAG TPA: HlyD family efflux transporter periplasmic adaptor subunit [Planctomycetota bacterium]|nr:HlyD family efflux transporter periplasmic adaptor subunit [Planctomycetota bacterium]
MSRLASSASWFALLALLALAGPAAFAEEKPEEGTKADEKKPRPTAKVEKGRFSIVVEGNGAFAPEGAAELIFEPEALAGEHEILEAVAPGPVEKDQVLLRLSSEKADEQVQNAARDLDIARKTLERQREEAKRAETTAAQALERAVVEQEGAAHALEYFLGTAKDVRLKRAELGQQAAKDNLQEQEEELAQLKKMYGSGDGLEETEDIVLRRTQRALDRAKVNFGFQQENHRHFLGWELPQEERGLKMNAAKEALDLERAKATVGPSLEIGRLELAKAEAGLERQAKAYAKLEKDLGALVMKAPRAGLAVPGSFAKGKWAGLDETARLFERKGKVRSGMTVFTIVEPGAVSVRLSVPEAQVLLVRPGQTAQVVPVADPTKTYAARVDRVAAVSDDGNYDVRLVLEGRDERLLPGFTCKVKIAAVEKSDVVTVPASAIGTDGETKVVHVLGDDDEPAPREVKLGLTSGGRVEVLEGLVGGERVLKTAPKAP